MTAMDTTGSETVIERVAAVPVERLGRYLGAQAPQTIAALLLPMPPDRAAAVLAGLSDDLRGRALRCLAMTRPLTPEIRSAMEEVLRADLLDAPADSDRAAKVARIVDALPPDLRAGAMDALGQPPAPMPDGLVAPCGEPGPSRGRPLLSPGLAAMLTGTTVIHDRLPMLEVVLDRFVRMLATTLRTIGGRAVVELAGIRSARFGDWLNGVAGRSPLLAVLHADPWDNYALLAPDRDLFDGVGEVLAGGDSATAGLRIAGRTPTGLDRLFAGRVAETMLADLGAAFAPVAAVTFTLDRLEDDPRHAVVTRLQNACLIVELVIRLDGRPGRMELIFPYATLEPVLDRLRQAFMGERFGDDPLWRTHLRGAVGQASARLRAEAGRTEVPLGALLSWRTGALLELDADAAGPVTLTVHAVAVAQGVLGRRGTSWAVAVDPAMIDDAPLPADEGTGVVVEDFPAGVLAATVPVSVVVGAAEVAIGGLAGIGRDTVLTLDRKFGEPVEVLAAGRRFAWGKLVAIGGRRAVRLTKMAAAGVSAADACA